MNLGNLRVGLTLFTQDFARQMRGLMASFGRVGSSASAAINAAFGPNAQNGINATNNAANRLGNSLRDVGRIASGIIISQIFYNATNAIQSSIGAVTRFTANMEDAQTSLKYFFNGNEAAAEGYLETMKDFAAVTPYATEQVVTLSRKLMGARFAPENIKGIMTILTDAASATGGTAEQMDRIVLAMAQIKTNGKLAGQEVRQLAEAGIPVYKILQEEMGLTADQMGRLGDLKVPGDLAVAAILKGLEKYKGATAELNDNFRGMWENIKDDMLFEASATFEAPYNALRGFIEHTRDYLEKSRIALQKNGRGGLFEAIVPKSIQEPIKVIIASIDVLIDAGKNLYNTLVPIFKTLGKVIITALSIVLPTISWLASSITWLTSTVVNAIPPVKWLGAALIGLLVGNMVGKSLMLLWRIVKLGTICTAVASAVKILSGAIVGLFTAMMAHPVATLFIASAVAALYFTGSLKHLSGWIANVTRQLNGMMGISTSGLLNPKENKTINDWMERYNKRLKEMDSNLKGVGKSAEKAGKKVKDKFVASFDELYQIPDMLDAVESGLGDIGVDIGDMPEMPVDDGFIGPMPLPSEDAVNKWVLAAGAVFAGTIGLALWAAWKAFKDKFGKGDGEGGGDNSLKLTVDPSGVIGIDALKNAIKQYEESLKNAQATTQAFSAENTNVMVPWGKSLQDVFNGVSAKVNEWSQTTQPVVTGWAQGTALAFENWATRLAEVMAGWKTNSTAATNSFAVEGTTAVNDFTVGTTTSLTAWQALTAVAMAAWKANNLDNLESWRTAAKGTIYAWASDTFNKYKSWANSMSGVSVGWADNSATNMNSWAEGSSDTMSQFTSSSLASYAAWAVSMAQNVKNWALNSLTNYGVFTEGATGAVTSLANNSASILNDSLVNTQNNIVTWAQSNADTYADMANTAIASIAAIAAAQASLGSGTGSIPTTPIVSAPAAKKFSVKGIIAAWNAAGASEPQWSKDYGRIADSAMLTVGGGGVLNKALGGLKKPVLNLLGLETGGIVDREQIVRVGERGRREAVIPLENSDYMRPFSAAVANDLMTMIGGQERQESSGGNDQRTIMVVGTLIADDRGLKELDRRMDVIRIQEAQRRGLV